MSKNKLNKKYIIILVSLLLLSIIGVYKYAQYRNQVTIEEFFSKNQTELNIIANYLDTHKEYDGIAYEDGNLLKYFYNHKKSGLITSEIICYEFNCAGNEQTLIESFKETKVSAFVFFAKYIEILDFKNVSLSDREIFMYKKDFFRDKKIGDKFDGDRYIRIKKIFDNDWGLLYCRIGCY